MNRKERALKIRKEVENLEKDMFNLLKEMLVINNYTYISENVNKVVDIMERELNFIGFKLRRINGKNTGDCLIANYKEKDDKLLLIAHTDIAQTLTKNESFEIKNNRIKYPGISDMKSCLVSMIFALKALKNLNLLDGNIGIVLSPDEEQGSIFGKTYIVEEALKSRGVVSMEAARTNGAIVEARKGGAYFDLKIEGLYTHSGSQFEKGISAIEELAHKIIKIHNITDLKKGITANVGHVNGGTTLGNAVSGDAFAKIDLKFWSLEAGREAIEKVKEICSYSDVKGTKLQLEGGMSFLPLQKTPASQKMIDIIINCADLLGFKLEAVASGGEADAGYPAAEGVPCVDGLGPIGGFHHSPEEYMEVDSFVERTALLAVSILEL